MRQSFTAFNPLLFFPSFFSSPRSPPSVQRARLRAGRQREQREVRGPWGRQVQRAGLHQARHWAGGEVLRPR